MRTQKPLESTGWLGGANNRLVVHEGAKAMKDLDSDVDDKQMTHSDEPTTEADLAAMRAFAHSVLAHPERGKRRTGTPVDGAPNTQPAPRAAVLVRPRSTA